MAIAIVRQVPPRRYIEQAEAIRSWLASAMQFVRDPQGAELLHSPEVLLATIAKDGVVYADCDDAAMLGCALAKSVGFQCRFVVVAFDTSNAPYSHVWGEISHDGVEWTELDVTRQAQAIAIDRMTRVRVWPV